MTDKEIVDGADVTITMELDEAAEARIIDVLSKVFVTNKYPGLRAAILDGSERYRQYQEMEKQQRFMEQSMYQNATKQPQNMSYDRESVFNQSRESVLNQLSKQKDALASSPSLSDRIMGKHFWK